MRYGLEMKVNVVVKPKEAVLDPQGAAVRDAMQHLGMPEVRAVRIGKFMEIEVDGKGADVEKRLHGLCRDLLSNPVIEDYELQQAEVRGQRSDVREKEANTQRSTPKAFASKASNSESVREQGVRRPAQKTAKKRKNQ
jgi:phosphoribosylformylglycinamidine synthase subunit PurS